MPPNREKADLGLPPAHVNANPTAPGAAHKHSEGTEVSDQIVTRKEHSPVSVLPERLLLELAQLQHQALRGRTAQSEDEVHQAEQAAIHVADWFSTKARWTAPTEDGIFVTVDEVAVAAERLISVRHMLLTLSTMAPDEETAQILDDARTLCSDVVKMLVTTPPESMLRDLATPPAARPGVAS